MTGRPLHIGWAVPHENPIPAVCAALADRKGVLKLDWGRL